MMAYLDDSYRSFRSKVSILRYEKGDLWQKDWAPCRDAKIQIAKCQVSPHEWTVGE